MSLGHQNSEDNEHSGAGGGHQDDRNSANPDINFWTNCSTLGDFIRRHKLHTSSFRRIVRRLRPQGGYRQEQTAIRITRDGKVEYPLDDVQPNDETEGQKIADEVRTADLPTSEWAMGLPDNLKEVDPANLYICRTQHEREGVWPQRAGEEQEKRHGILFVVQRIDQPNGEKLYLPWSYWNDQKWRRMEPDGKLPLYGLHRLNDTGKRVYVHEGAKAARAAQEIADGLHPEHPLAQELAGTIHLGWLGGALNPGRTDWEPLKKLSYLYIVADRDTAGESAVPVISKALKIPITAVLFDDRFRKNFDLADDWPEKENNWRTKKGDYIGPTLEDFEEPATWATDEVPLTKNKTVCVLRKVFADDWFYVDKQEVFVNRRQPHVQRNEQSLNKYLRKYSDSPKTADLMLKVVSRASRLIYRPYRQGKALVVIKEDKETLFNTYQPPTIMPKPLPKLPSDDPLSCDPSPFIEYMTYLIPDADERHHLMRWCATLIARPEQRMEWAVLMYSEETGIGKTTLGAKILAPLVGKKHNVSFPNERTITNPEFNGWYAEKRLAICNELYAGKDDKAYHRLKDIITDEDVSMNEKYEKRRDLECVVHIYACSNSPRALTIDDHDRRWFLPEVTETKRPKAYWKQFNAWLAEGGLPIIRQWAECFLKFNEQVEKGERAPDTVRKRELIEEQRTPGLRDVLALGENVKEAMTERQQKIVVSVEDVLTSVRERHKGRVEGRDKLIAMLTKAGLLEPVKEKGKDTRRFKLGGVKTRVFANFTITLDMGASDLVDHWKKASDLWPI